MIDVNSASASNDWYAFKSCANSGVHCAFNLRVLATIASDFIWILISGIAKLSAAVDSAFAYPAPDLSSKSPRVLSVGCAL